MKRALADLESHQSRSRPTRKQKIKVTYASVNEITTCVGKFFRDPTRRTPDIDAVDEDTKKKLIFHLNDLGLLGEMISVAFLCGHDVPCIPFPIGTDDLSLVGMPPVQLDEESTSAQWTSWACNLNDTPVQHGAVFALTAIDTLRTAHDALRGHVLVIRFMGATMAWNSDDAVGTVNMSCRVNVYSTSTDCDVSMQEIRNMKATGGLTDFELKNWRRGVLHNDRKGCVFLYCCCEEDASSELVRRVAAEVLSPSILTLKADEALFVQRRILVWFLGVAKFVP